MPLPFARSASQTRPTFSRDFAGLKTLDHGVGPAITFTRASNATFFDASGVLQTASNDVPRFDHDPATGASRGLLIEEARTNLRLHSADFTQAAWSKVSATVTANAITAPDGTLSADKLESIKTGTGVEIKGGQVVNATSATCSVFLKKGTGATVGNRVQLRNETTTTSLITVDVNLDTGAISYVTGSSGASTVNVGDGWWRVSLTATSGITSGNNISMSVLDNFIKSMTTGDFVYAWGAQVEEGAFPTSYIPTTTAAATRSADSAVVTPISGFYNQSEGTFVAEASYIGKTSGVFSRIFSFGNLSTTPISDPDRWFWGFNDANTNHLVQQFTAGVFDYGVSFATSANTVYKVASAIALNNARSAQNGSLLGSDDTSVGAPSNKTRMAIGGSPTGTAGTALHFRKIAYYPRRLSNTLLQQLTT